MSGRPATVTSIFRTTLAEAGEREKLDDLLLDPGWLKAKLDATGSPQALFSDYQLYGAGEAQNLIGRTLRVISGICARDPRQLSLQLAKRLEASGLVGAKGFVERAHRLISAPAIVSDWAKPCSAGGRGRSL
jgi:hypothetical protein